MDKRIKYLNRIVAGGVFLVSFIQLALTVQPSISFWDCGEYASTAYALQVNHQPGNPIYLMICRLFQMIPIGDPAWRTNMLSVITGAFSVSLMYLISAEIILLWRKKIETKTDMLLVFGASVIGALAFSFSDAFWFNSVETEIYTPGMLLIALEIWLALQWHKRAYQPGNERYLLLIAYLFGLGTTLYLFTILPLFLVVMLVYFRKYKITVKSFLIMCGAAICIFGSIYPGIVLWLPTMIAGNLPYFETTDASGYKMPLIQNSPAMPVLAVLIILGIAYFLWWSLKTKKNPLWSILSLAWLCVLAGYLSVAIVLLRSNAHPPRNTGNPDTFQTLATYLTRADYNGGMPPILPRRWAHYSVNQPMWKNYSSDAQFFWKYQVEHQYLRYLFWQFIGRGGDVLNAPVGFQSVMIPDAKKDLQQWWYDSTYDTIFPIRFYGIPFLLGLLGMFWHFKRDWKTGLVCLAGFLVMGIFAALVQNQQDPQDRDRDYFYPGSFFIYSMWIGFGAMAIFEWMEKKYRTRMIGLFASALGVAALIFVAVDVNLCAGGWKMHDRSGNFVPWDYAYNILQSCAPHAILFTDDDNAMFPLWYLQDVVRIRRDIRIVNPLNSPPWYVSQLKNDNHYGSDCCPISIPQEMLDRGENDPNGFNPVPGESKTITLPVPRDTMAHYTNDSALLAHPSLTFTYPPSESYIVGGKQTTYFSRIDQSIFNIIKTNAEKGWTRPIYWVATCWQSRFVGLDEYTRTEGLTKRLVPIARQNDIEMIDEHAMEQNLMHEPAVGFTDAQYGFRFRSLNDQRLYLDETHRIILQNYRQAFLTLADYYVKSEKKDFAHADEVLNMMNEKIPHELFPMRYVPLWHTATLYRDIGDSANFHKYTGYLIALSKQLLYVPGLQQYIDRRYPPYVLLSDLFEHQEDYAGAIDALNGVLPFAQNQPYDQRLIHQEIYELQVKDDNKKGKYAEGIEVAEQALAYIGSALDQNAISAKQNFQRHIGEMRQKAGMPMDSAK